MSDAVRVEVYYTDGCGYCTGATSLLERKGVDFIRHRVDQECPLIDDRHVGGLPSGRPALSH